MAPGKKRGRQSQRSENTNTKTSYQSQNNRTENKKEDLNEWPDLSNSGRSFQDQKRNVKSEKNLSEVSSEISNSVSLQDYSTPESAQDLSQAHADPYRGKYSKRAVTKNWDRYDKEPEVDDEERGADFETLLSYSGGSGTQFRLLDEKDWDDNINESDKNDFLSLDCNALASALQCIPLHKRLGLPEDIFTPEIVSRFQHSAEQYSRQYCPMSKKTSYNERSSPAVQSELKTGANSLTKEVTDVYKLNHKQSFFDKTAAVTENLMESLTSCLSLKEVNDLSISEITPLSSNEKVTETSTKDQPYIADGDLDFLLSLSVPSTKLSLPSSKKDAETAAKKKSIDEWLDSVLED